MLAVVAGGAALTAVGAVPAEAAAIACPPGMTACGKKCRATYIDPDNCGACGHSCATNEVCRKGVCVAFGDGSVCAAGQTDCSGTCIDLSSSHDNCGACGTACAAGQTCQSGVCVGCLAGETDCSGTCIDLSSSHDNCGACGTACAAGETCSGGVCVECVVATDCAGVDTECATRTCVSGVCGQSFAAFGTPLTSQTTGDCHKNVCDGSGGSTVVVDDSDLPADDGNICTQEVCIAGVPSHPNRPASYLCVPGGVNENPPPKYCDGLGNCV